jgi:putative phage-type endonuclease
MPNIVEIESFQNTVGIGASQVAAVLHLDPWTSAYELWQQKSGRKEKPPRTAAMQFGIDLERKAMDAYYRDKGIEPMQEQVAGIHATIPYLRAVVDGWDGERGHGVNVKVPSGFNTIEAAEFGWIPRHYQIQMAAEMAVFAAYSWDFCVYVAETDETIIIPVRWDDLWDAPDVTLRQFWEGTVTQKLGEFWNHLESEKEWGDADPTPMPDAQAWQEACIAYRELKKSIAQIEEEVAFQGAKIKQLMGMRSRVSLGGFKAEYQTIKASWGVKISVDSLETVGRIKEVLAPLASAEGVEKIADANREESRRFVVAPLKKGQA